MADDAENMIVVDNNTEDNSAKRKTPEKKEKKKKDTPPPMERRKSSRLLEKPTKKYADDEDKVSDEDFTPSSRSSSRGLKRKTSKGIRAKKAKSEDDADGNEDNEDVNHSSSTSSSSSTVNPPSQDGLSKLTNTYNDVQSQDFSLQTYKRNQDYIQPLGKLTKEQVEKGRQVLDELKVFIEAGDVENRKLTDLTNQFYTIVPSQAESLPTIKTKTELEENYNLLESLVG